VAHRVNGMAGRGAESRGGCGVEQRSIGFVKKNPDGGWAVMLTASGAVAGLAPRRFDGGSFLMKSRWVALLNGLGLVLFLGPYCGVGLARLFQFQYSKSFPIINVAPIWKNTNSILLDLQNFPSFTRWKINSKGATFLLVRSLNSQ
jgi:hypothetical protein